MKKWNWWIGLTILAVALSFVEWRYPMPTGTLDVQLTGIAIAGICLGLSVSWSYLTFVIVGLVMLVNNLQNWWILIPILLTMLVLSLMLKWRTSLNTHMEHSQAINFALVVGGVQFIGMILIIAIQAIMMTNQWDEFLAIIEMALPASVLNGLLDCLLVPPLTLLVRHYTENVKKE